MELRQHELKILKLLSEPHYINLSSHQTAKLKLTNLGLLSYEGNRKYKITTTGMKILQNAK